MVVFRYPAVRKGVSDENVGEAGGQATPCSLSNTRTRNRAPVSKSIDLRKKYALDADWRKIHSSVSKGRTPWSGVRYTRKKLPLASHKGGVERDSWDMSSSKTPTLGRHFLRRNRYLGSLEVGAGSPLIVVRAYSH